MRSKSFIYIPLFLLLFCSSCSNKNSAKNYLSEAESAFKNGNYQLAKLKVDSVKNLFPKAFDEIKSGFALMQKIRLAENERNIAFCDSMLAINESVRREMLRNFDYVRNENYEEKGVYYPKIYPLQTSLSQNGLRSGVSETGALIIESIFAGSALKHTHVKVSTAGGEFAETLPVASDGLNYRFSTGERTYEIVRYTGKSENDIARFIYTFRQEPLTIAFIGNRNASHVLGEAQKKGISQSFEFALLISETEKLKFEKERSEALIRYLKHEHVVEK